MSVHVHHVGAQALCWCIHTMLEQPYFLEYYATVGATAPCVLGQELLLVHAHHVGAMAQVVGAGTSWVGACSPLIEFVDKRRPLLAAPSREMM